ncbi:MAG: NAD(P)/FAD-dependent oxidoreductase, partial [Acidimicrobiales bacterium]
MTDQSTDVAKYDAIIIGAGVLGGAVAHELARRGVRTLNVDKAASAGAGSTSNSCAIVRFTYSTAVGVALAWEGLHYWTDWPAYIGTDDELGLIEYHRCGMFNLTMGDDDHASKVRALWSELGIPFEDWTLADLTERLPILDQGLYGPPKRPDDPHFWDDAHGTVNGALFAPDAGYVSDPQLSCHNLQRGAEANGGEFWFNAEVSSIDRSDGRVTGVTLADGRSVEAPVVVNVAGPHSQIINRMAGVYDAMNIKTRPLRHEVHHVPAPQGFDFMADGL